MATSVTKVCFFLLSFLKTEKWKKNLEHDVLLQLRKLHVWSISVATKFSSKTSYQNSRQIPVIWNLTIVRPTPRSKHLLFTIIHRNIFFSFASCANSDTCICRFRSQIAKQKKNTATKVEKVPSIRQLQCCILVSGRANTLLNVIPLYTSYTVDLRYFYFTLAHVNEFRIHAIFSKT